MAWLFPVVLAPSARVPLFQQIARAIAADVGRGRLRPGDRLPGSRRLATTLGVHRSTVVTAYAELCAQGWAATRARGATYIAETSPDVVRPDKGDQRSPRGVASEAGFTIEPLATPHFRAPTATPAPRGAVALWWGIPDLRLVPQVALGRALRRVARRGRALLAYTAERAGHPPLREQLARLLATTRGLPVRADDVFVTQGSQQALDLTARALIRPGDVVAVEALGYRPAWGAFERAGARLLPVALDGEGLDVGQLEAACAGPAPPRAVYLTPHHQYPTTVVLSPRRRSALLALAARHHLAVIEDDYDHEFHYDGRPVLPLASADGGRHVIYIGSLAKVLAPGLRVGFVVGARDFLARLGEERMLADRQGNGLVEAAVAELLEDGEVERHARRARRIYQRRRDVLCAALVRHLGHVLTVAPPPGGMTLWVKTAPDIDVESWQERGRAAGVLFHAGSNFAFAPPRHGLPAIRLGFAACDERALELGVLRLARSLPSALPSPRRR